MTIAQDIKLILSHPEWTQRRLAEEVGVSQTTISRFSTGDREPRLQQGKDIEAIASKVKRQLARKR